MHTLSIELTHTRAYLHKHILIQSQSTNQMRALQKDTDQKNDVSHFSDNNHIAFHFDSITINYLKAFD